MTPFYIRGVEIRYDILGAAALIICTMFICTSMIERKLIGIANISAQAAQRIEKTAEELSTQDGNIVVRIQQIELSQRIISDEESENTEQIRDILNVVRKRKAQQ